MTRDEFKIALKGLGMTRRAFAEHTGVHPATVYHWNGATQPIPRWAVMLVAAWQDNMRLSHIMGDKPAEMG